jgi:methylglutaconyl-CoA hydratase
MPTNPSTTPGASAGQVQATVSNGVATVSFHHPKGNSLPGPLLTRLAEEIAAQGRNTDAAVIVLRSEGSGPFCAGASFDELKAIKDPVAGQEFFSGFSRVILAMIRAPKFVLTRVHGKVAGGGIGIVAASDYSIATQAAPVRLSELAIGIGPFIVGLAIEHKIGLASFSTLAVDAEWHDAAWCERHGLYGKVVADGTTLDEAVQALAAALAKSNPEAMAELKRIFWRGTDQWEQTLAERAAMSGRMVLSDFTRRALTGFDAR